MIDQDDCQYSCYDDGYSRGRSEGYALADNERKTMLHVVNNWSAYREIIRDLLHHTWMDISNDAGAKYMSDPDDLRCRFCGCAFVLRLADAKQPHAEYCIWWKIAKLHNMTTEQLERSASSDRKK